MRRTHWPRLALVVAWLAGAGCTSLREIPRTDYASMPERKHVRIETREGLVYEFDYVRVSGDSLVGYRRRDVEGPVDEYAVQGVSLDAIQRLSARGLDWYRTGLIGGGVLAAVLVAGLTGPSPPTGPPDPGGGPGGGRVP